MNNDLSHLKETDDQKEYISLKIGDQHFGISVYAVRDILAPQKITSIPLAPVEVAGSLNLRGRIVTAINIKFILDIDSNIELNKCMSIVVEYQGELYSLIVDSIGEVLTLSKKDFIHNPENFPSNLKDISLGIYPLKDKLLIILDIEKLLQSIAKNN
ncbi:MAG: chemotaxis protein CheW [Alphaproteobacteria bacterium]